MKLIKGLSVLAFAGFLGLATTSCLNNDDNADFTNYGYLPTNGTFVKSDSIMPVNKTTNVQVSYTKTNSCQRFEQFSLLQGSNDSVHYIGVLGVQTTGSTCTPATSIETKVLKFTPKRTGKFKLKFWTGKDANQKDTFNDSIVFDIKAQ